MQQNWYQFNQVKKWIGELSPIMAHTQPVHILLLCVEDKTSLRSNCCYKYTRSLIWKASDKPRLGEFVLKKFYHKKRKKNRGTFPGKRGRVRIIEYNAWSLTEFLIQEKKNNYQRQHWDNWKHLNMDHILNNGVL